MACANRGQQLVHLRVDVQHARQREVVLTWLLCPSCGHVALADWTWRDCSAPGQSTSNMDGEDDVARDLGDELETR